MVHLRPVTSLRAQLASRTRFQRAGRDAFLPLGFEPTRQEGQAHGQNSDHRGPGGPEQFRIVDHEVGDPGPGQIRIRHEACGLNFIDVYQRTGLYPLQMPHALGMEAAGVVEAVGEGVTHLKEGDRAAYAADRPAPIPKPAS
jgi:hypothetical protein